MGWFSRKPKVSRERAKEKAAVVDAAEAHLVAWAREREGVEAWIEPETTISTPSMLLVAWDGESTRRTVRSVEAGHRLAAKMKVPAHDAGIVSYPQRLRDYNARQKIDRRREAQ
ncbi:hypothetical protein GCM10027418_15610 [Mariniluteicoccus endophyticus]